MKNISKKFLKIKYNTRMNKVTIKKIGFKLIGETIEKNNHLSFKAIDRNDKIVSIDDFKGIKIISLFPDIQTRVCDVQTRKIAKYAKENPKINFISITMDTVSKINKWCLASGVENIHIWSDWKLREFSSKTNAIIRKINKLARGFIILDDKNKIIEVSLNSEIAQEPDYSVLEKYL